MGCHEVLVVRVLNITNNNRAASNESVVFASRVEVHAVRNLSTESNRVVKLDLVSLNGSSLSSAHLLLSRRSNGHLILGLHL